MDIGGSKVRASSKNKALIWSPTRDTKPDYDKVPMVRKPIPTKYKDKNARRVARELKETNRLHHKQLMKTERKQDKSESRKAKIDVKMQRKIEKTERRKRKADRAEARQERKEKRKARKKKDRAKALKEKKEKKKSDSKKKRKSADKYRKEKGDRKDLVKDKDNI